MTDDDTNLSELERRSYLAAVAGLASASAAGCLGAGRTADGTHVRVPKIVGYGGVVLATSASSMTLATSDSESEPNDTQAAANPIQTGVDVTGRRSPAEVDWFAFDAAGGATLTVQLAKNGKSGVVSLAAYDTSGSFVDEVYVSSDVPVDLKFDASETGTYFVQIVDVESGNGAYELRVDTTGGETTATPTPTPTATETASPTSTPTETATDNDYGLLGYGEYDYGGTA